MRGSPPLHLILFAVGFALLAVPLAHLTFARPAAPEVQAVDEKPESVTTSTLVRIRFAHPPQSLSVKLGERELLTPQMLHGAKSVIELQQDLTLGHDGIEFLVTAQWPAGTPDTALSVELEPDGLDAQSQTRWSSGGSLAEALAYHWKP